MLKTYNAKVNWQATSKDMVNFLFFNGDKIKEGRAPGNALFEPTSARFNQGNYYTDNPLHGLWKLEDNRVFSNDLFVTGKYAYYNTGFTLESIGPLTEQMGISALHGQTFGSTNASYFLRPQHTVNIDANYFRTMGDNTHDFKFGFGWRRTDIYSRTIYPGNGVGGLRELGDRLPRPHLPRGRRHQPRVVHQLLRRRHHRLRPYDPRPRPALRPSVGRSARQPDGGERSVRRPSCPASASPATMRRSTGTTSRPRVGVTYALDEASKSIVRASFSRNAGQLTSVGTYIGYANPSSAAGWVEYPWVDANGDHLAQTNEVRVNLPLLASGGGFNTANPTAVTSANQIDPDFKAPASMGFILGYDRELRPESRRCGELHLRPGHQPPDDAVHRFDDGRLGADGAAHGHDCPTASRTTFRCSFRTPTRWRRWAADGC